MSELLVLVDKNDKAIGIEEKMKVHVDGLFHRAFSIMIFNGRGELLVQKRSANKYHSAGLWANSCCGHPRLNEGNKEAAQRRLKEELGFSCELMKIAEISYSLELQDGLYENEYTHLFAGFYQGGLNPNPNEVSKIKWKLPSKLRQESMITPENNARWFNLYLQKYYQEIFEDNLFCNLYS